MGFSLSDIFSSGASTLVSTLGEAIDKVVTSDEERLNMKNQAAIIAGEVMSKTQAAAMREEEERTTRHTADMKSDSWLSKNIRPGILLFLTVSTVLMVAFACFSSSISTDKLPMIQALLSGVLMPLLLSAFGFYFTSRGAEKMAGIITLPKLEKIKRDTPPIKQADKMESMSDAIEYFR